MATPSARSRTFMTSSSSSHQPPFDYLGCSNCADDFLANHSQSPASFWLMECGHVSCASCLGFPNVSTLDTTQQYRCPIPSCAGFQSAVYELNGEVPLHPAIQEFFETPDSITQRLETVLTFQNRQMRLRIKNLHKLVELQRQTLRQNRSALAVLPTFKQQIHDLKRELNHWRSLQQREPSDPSRTTTTHGPAHSNQSNPSSSKASFLGPNANTVDQSHQVSHGMMSDRSGGLTRINSDNRHRRTWPSPHPQSFNNSPNLPPQSPAILNRQPRTSNPSNLRTPAKLPRTISLGTNSELSRNNSSRQSELGVHRRSSSGQVSGRIAAVGAQNSVPNVYDRSLQAIPEDEDEPINDQVPLRRVSSRSEPVNMTVRRPSNPAMRPVRTTPSSRIQPMPLPGPSRLPPSARTHQQSAPRGNDGPLVYPANPHHHRAPHQNPPATPLLNTSTRFSYREDQNLSHGQAGNRNQIRDPEEQQPANRRFPYNVKRPATSNPIQNIDERASSKRRLNSFTNPPDGFTPRFHVARGHPPQPP